MTDVLTKYVRQIEWVCKSVQESFELPDHALEDLQQDAAILILSYAGEISGLHFNKINQLTRIVGDDEAQLKHLVAMTLRLDLTQQVSRELDRIIPVDENPVDDCELSEPSFEQEVFSSMDEARLLRRYPLFARNVLDGVTQDKLAAELGIDERTVRRRIAGEKRSFLLTMLKRRGIVVEGDEPMHELEEAYRSLTHM